MSVYRLNGVRRAGFAPPPRIPQRCEGLTARIVCANNLPSARTDRSAELAGKEVRQPVRTARTRCGLVYAETARGAYHLLADPHRGSRGNRRTRGSGSGPRRGGGPESTARPPVRTPVRPLDPPH